jgi:hypothetical protein
LQNQSVSEVVSHYRILRDEDEDLGEIGNSQ